MSLTIVADMHHGGLYNSLKLLAKRLDANIYRPIGLDWFNEGFWKIAEPYNNNEQTIIQFLSEASYEPVTRYVNGGLVKEAPGMYRVPDVAHESEDLAITLKAFKYMTVDVMIVTYAHHLPSWIQLRDQYQPNAKIVLQVGNHGWESYFPLTRNLLSSCKYGMDTGVPNYVEYRQEFSTEVFRPSTSPATNTIASFVNCLPREDYCRALQNLLPEYNFKFYGEGCPDDVVTGISNIADIMRTCKFGLHIKPGGDGYGHVLHNWSSVGVPVITDMSDYNGKMAGDLLQPSQTCVVITGDPIKDAESIRYFGQESVNSVMRDNVKHLFQETVNFNKEFEEKLVPFFYNLQ